MLFNLIFFLLIITGGFTGSGESSILGGVEQKYTDQLMAFLKPVLKPNSKLVRCWRADESPENWRAKKFHEGCDGKGPTVTIVKVGDNIFGGFTDIPWESKFLRGQSHEDFVPELLRLLTSVILKTNFK